MILKLILPISDEEFKKAEEAISKQEPFEIKFTVKYDNVTHWFDFGGSEIYQFDDYYKELWGIPYNVHLRVNYSEQGGNSFKGGTGSAVRHDKIKGNLKNTVIDFVSKFVPLEEETQIKLF